MLFTTIKTKEYTVTITSILCLLLLMALGDTVHGKTRRSSQRIDQQGSDSIAVRITTDDNSHQYYDYGHDYDYNYDFNFDFEHDFSLDYNGEMLFVMPDWDDMEFLLEETGFYEDKYRMQEDEFRMQEDAIRMQSEELRHQEEAIREGVREGMRMSQRSRVRFVDGEQDQIKQSYQDAYNLVLQGKWKRALDAMNKYLTKYPRSRYEDDARFWVCYSMA